MLLLIWDMCSGKQHDFLQTHQHRESKVSGSTTLAIRMHKQVHYSAGITSG